jgi:hypothetical protein
LKECFHDAPELASDARRLAQGSVCCRKN